MACSDPASYTSAPGNAPPAPYPPAGSAWRLDVRRGAAALGAIFRFGLFPYAGLLPVPFFRRTSFAVRFRHSLESLGLTYLKLGQFLALRFDILPAEICEELNNLFEQIPPMPPGAARQIVEAELGASLETLYAGFEPAPLAAASVAQVHRAVLHDGSRVAVKVQRRGLEPVFRADIRNLRRLSAIGEKLGVFGRLSVRGMIDQFATWTLRELDFRVEGRTADRVRRESGPNVVVPRVHWRLTGERVLTMEFLEGISAAKFRDFVDSHDPAAVAARLPGFDEPTALANFADASLSQLFVAGFFHGDPHPGNIVFLPQNKIGFLDFGIFGALTDVQREVVTAQVQNLALGDLVGSFRAYARQVVATPATDLDRFRDDAMQLLKRWFQALSEPSSSIAERHLARYTGEMIDVSRRNGLIYDLSYLLFWRALNNLNATIWHVAPHFDLVRHLRGFFAEITPSPLAGTKRAVAKPKWRVDALAAARRVLPAEANLAASLGLDGRAWPVTAGRPPRRQREMAAEEGGRLVVLLTLPLALLLPQAGLWALLPLGLAALLVAVVVAVRRARPA